MINELNKKLAQWAGIQTNGDAWYYDGEWHLEPPNFSNSLDACFKWLVPKLQIALYSYPFEVGDKKFFACVMNGDGYADSIAETPALAFCLAVEKLIEL